MVRVAVEDDVPTILELIRELAIFEKEPDAVINTVEGLSKDLFIDKVCEAIVYEQEGEVVAFAIYYTSYSTWKGPCIYLEDLLVTESHRGQGIGSELFDEVVRIAKSRDVARMDWQVLDWNTPAIEFYKKKQATLDDEWINGRLFFK